MLSKTVILSLISFCFTVSFALSTTSTTPVPNPKPLLDTGYVANDLENFSTNSWMFAQDITTIAPSLSLACDFESGTICKWKNSAWVVGTPALDYRMPKADHTKNNNQGHFAYIRHKIPNFIESASAFMTITDNGVTGSGGIMCFKLWYYLYAELGSQINVTVRSPNNTIVNQMTKQTNHGFQWNQIQLETNVPKNGYTYTISALVRAGVIAVDDITAQHQSCQQTDPNVFRCTFEGGSNCGFTPVVEANTSLMFWNVSQGSDTHIKTGDHTLKTQLGYFYGFDFYNLEKLGYSTTSHYKIVSKYFAPTRESCVTFSYLMQGQIQNESFNFYQMKEDSLNGVKLWRANGDLGPFWYSERKTISSAVKWRIGFDVSTHESNKGLIAVDDIIVELDKSCPPKGWCDFERKDTCMWESVPPNLDIKMDLKQKLAWANLPVGAKVDRNILRYTDFEWEVHSPDFDSDHSYPSTDHTLRKASGFYLLMRAQTLDSVGDRAVLVSDHYDIDGNRSFCLSFYYYLKSSLGGGFKLEVYQNEDILVQSYKIAQINGTTPTSDWTQFNITAKPNMVTSTNMWFYLVGDVSSFDSAIALDDISIVPGQCQSNPVTISTSTTPREITKQTNPIVTRSSTLLTLATVSSTISPSSQLSCDFETATLCGWKNTIGYWAVIYPGAYTQKSSIKDLMPSRDHTLKNMHGHFAYLSHSSEDSHPFKRDIMSIKYNGVVVSGGPVCFRLWYYMRTNGEVELNVTARAQDDTEVELIMRKKDHGDKWNQLMFETSIDKNSFTFEISALAKLGVVAIDDIRIENKSCMDIDPDNF